MIGFGSPADTMRESDVIVLMVSPLLALRLVIDHNTEQRPEFPRFFHHDRAWISWKCPIEQAPPNPYGESMQATYSRATTERIVGDSEPPMFRAFSRPPQGCRRSPAQTRMRVTSLARGRIRFGSSQNPGCGAVRSDAVARRSLRDFTD